MKTILTADQQVRIFEILHDFLEGQYEFVRNTEYPKDERDEASKDCDVIEALTDFLTENT